MKSHKKLAAVLALLLALSMLAACTQSSTPPADGGTEAGANDSADNAGNEAQPSDPAPSGDGLNVVFNTGLGALAVWDDNDFYDGKVNWLGYPENELDTKIKLEMISGSKGFDLGITQASGAKQYGALGLLDALEPLDDWDDVFEGNRMQHSIGDTIYGYPILADINLLYYNREYFADAGYDAPPATWDEYREYAKHLTIDANGVRGDEEGFDPSNIQVYGTMFKGVAGNANPWELAVYAYSNGASYIEKDFDNLTYEVTCNQPNFVDTLQWLYDLYDVDKSMPQGFVNYDYNEFEAMGTEGNVAMWINWPSMYLGRIPGSKVDGQIAIAELPQGTLNNASPIGGWSIGVYKASAQLEEAHRFAKIFASQESNREYAKINGATPPRTSLLEEMIADAETAGEDDLVQYYRAILANLTTGREMDLAQTNTAAEDCQKAAATKINAVLAGQMGAQQAMDELKAELEEILEANNYMHEGE